MELLLNSLEKIIHTKLPISEFFSKGPIYRVFQIPAPLSRSQVAEPWIKSMIVYIWSTSYLKLMCQGRITTIHFCGFYGVCWKRPNVEEFATFFTDWDIKWEPITMAIKESPFWKGRFNPLGPGMGGRFLKYPVYQEKNSIPKFSRFLSRVEIKTSWLYTFYPGQNR